MNMHDAFGNIILPAIGAYTGAAASGDDKTVTSTQTPYLQPYIGEVAQQGQQLYGNPMPVYGGQTWAGPTANQYAGWDAAAGWASPNNPYVQQMSSMANTLQGGAPFQTNAQQTGPAAQAAVNQTGPAAQATTQQANVYQTGPQQVAQNAQLGPQQYAQTNLAGPAAQAQNVGSARSQIGAAPTAVSAGPTERGSAATNYMMGMNNPYLNSAINYASQDAARNYNQTVAPQRQAQMQASGSFGNTGVQQMQLEDQRNLQNTLGQIATNARMQDYTMQAGLAENLANRQTGVSQFNAGQGNQMGMFNAGQANQMAGLGYSTNANAAMFDVGQGNQMNMYNAGQANNQNQFNAAQGNAMNTFNAGQGNAMNMFGVGQQNAMNTFNAGQGNTMGMYNTGQANQGAQFNAGQQNAASLYNTGQTNANNQFNTGQANSLGMYNAGQMNANNQFNVGQGNAVGMTNTAANNSAYNTALNTYAGLNNNALNAANTLIGIGGQQQGQMQAGLNDAQARWNAETQSPYAAFNNYAQLISGLSGGNAVSQNYPGNPYIGGLGGAMTLPKVFGY